MDGEHVLMRPPAHSGSYYFNYKHTFSIVLLAIVNTNYKFIFVDVGCNGRISGVYHNSEISTAFEENSLNVPGPKPLPETEIAISYTLVADDAFPLKACIQTPYSQIGLTKERRIFNYRLSRARRIVKNAFGILANRFRVFMTPGPEKMEKIILACCSLHNFLRSSQACSIYTPPGCFDNEDPDTHHITPGGWRQETSKDCNL